MFYTSQNRSRQTYKVHKTEASNLGKTIFTISTNAWAAEDLLENKKYFTAPTNNNIIEHGIGQDEIQEPPIDHSWNRYNRSRSCKGVMQHPMMQDHRMEQTMDHGYYRSISDEERSANTHFLEGDGFHFIAESTYDLPTADQGQEFFNARCNSIRENEFADARCHTIKQNGFTISRAQTIRPNEFHKPRCLTIKEDDIHNARCQTIRENTSPRYLPNDMAKRDKHDYNKCFSNKGNEFSNPRCLTIKEDEFSSTRCQTIKENQSPTKRWYKTKGKGIAQAIGQTIKGNEFLNPRWGTIKEDAYNNNRCHTIKNQSHLDADFLTIDEQELKFSKHHGMKENYWPEPKPYERVMENRFKDTRASVDFIELDFDDRPLAKDMHLGRINEKILKPKGALKVRLVEPGEVIGCTKRVDGFEADRHDEIQSQVVSSIPTVVNVMKVVKEKRKAKEDKKARKRAAARLQQGRFLMVATSKGKTKECEELIRNGAPVDFQVGISKSAVALPGHDICNKDLNKILVYLHYRL